MNRLKNTAMMNPQNELPRFPRVVLYIYFIISIFEPYLNGVFGSITKYYIIFVILVLFMHFQRIKIRSVHLAYLGWILYKILSLLWSESYATPKIHFISQIGMIAFLIVLTAVEFDVKTLKKILMVYCVSSGIIGLLSIFFADTYHGVSLSRQVLILFGVESDPNNQAALMMIGICVSLFNLFYAKENRILSAVILLVNTFACFITASRGGLLTLTALIIFVFFVQSGKATFKNTIVKILFLAVILTLFYYIAKYYLSQIIYNRLFNFSSYSGGSDRDILWTNAWNLYTRDLFTILFGAGWGTATIYTGLGLGVHNTFLTMLCDVGLFGTLLFMLPIFSAAVTLLRLKKVLPVMLLISQFIPSFFIDAINKRFFWNAIFILFIYYYNEKKITKESADRNPNINSLPKNL